MQPSPRLSLRARLLVSAIFSVAAALYVFSFPLPALGDGYESVPAALIASFVVMYVAAPKIARNASRANPKLRAVGAGVIVTVAAYGAGAILFIILRSITSYQLNPGESVIEAVFVTVVIAMVAPFFGYLLLLLALPFGITIVWLFALYAERNANTAA